MIYDAIDHAKLYSLGRGFDLAFEYLRSDRAATDPVGKYLLDGDRVFALVQEYQTKPESKGLWEAHFLYADVQYVGKGFERMGVAPLSAMTLKENRAPKDDVALYTGEGVFLPMDAGKFTVFFPQDVHMPGIANGEAQPVRKVVVKVRLDG